MILIISNGVDLVEIQRMRCVIQRHGERFLSRIYTQRERQETGEKPESLAARFAAKEAVAKALGTGIGAVKWTDIEISYGPSHQPVLNLYGNAAEIAKKLGLDRWSVSLSHTTSIAIAMVVAASSTHHS
jgi:holo-[acyl-carrier protein] synthase